MSLDRLFLGCGDELARVEGRGLDLLAESIPSLASELLPEYERELDLAATGTDAERLARVIALYVARQGFRPVDLQATLAPLLGLDASQVIVIETTLWNVRKTGGINGDVTDAGASSVQAIAGDGYVEHVCSTVAAGMFLGLNATDASTVYADIDYAFYQLSDLTLRVYENGTDRGLQGSPWSAGDILRIQRVGTTITYYKNGLPVYTSGVASSAPLRVDCTLEHFASVLKEIRLVDAGVPKAISWQSITNVTPTMSLPDVREVYRFFVYRNPSLPGTWYITSAQQLLDTIKPSHTLGYVIEDVDAEYEEPTSLYDRDIMGN